ncbi:MAG TPA: methyltransferase [Daejeonella sp.]|uniref:tRNA1(Val) (adenine(37)-N6)-methyltransferase n=1 Tax=Daejeonella sp. TaxID=2805397 RepID=UPI002EDAD165
MKVNTDGVLLAAMADFKCPAKILDVGTGTGLIALMLAQKYTSAIVHAVEIDQSAADTAKLNFLKSPFSNRIALFHSSIKEHFTNSTEQYDLIISNPPFFINSLSSQNEKKSVARHTDLSFFEVLLTESAKHLDQSGHLCIILPLETAEMVKKMDSGLKVQKEILIYSFADSKPHRTIMVMGFEILVPLEQKIVIYESKGVYSMVYRDLLKDYLTIF